MRPPIRPAFPCHLPVTKRTLSTLPSLSLSLSLSLALSLSLSTSSFSSISLFPSLAAPRPTGTNQATAHKITLYEGRTLGLGPRTGAWAGGGRRWRRGGLGVWVVVRVCVWV